MALGRSDGELTASERYRLEAGRFTSGRRRAGLLRAKNGIVVGETELVVLAQRLPASVRAALAGGRIPDGKALAPLAVRRRDRREARRTCHPGLAGAVAVGPG
jgi:hypothetical protein